MLLGFDLNHLFLFPVRDGEARKQFLIGALIYLAGSIVPIVPFVLASGYTARIMRQVLNGEQPRMTAWDRWEEFLQDGIRIFGVRLIYMAPLLIVVIPLTLLMFAMPFWMETLSSSDADALLALIPLVVAVVFMLIVPISFALGIATFAAETHVVQTAEFAAAFRFREWWDIFRRNWGGFLVAFAISYVLSTVLTVLAQIAMITIILICLLPLILPGITMYTTLVMYAATAKAYKDGKDKLALETAEALPS
ncbi:MAG: DUF4013 domain-containing protein [Chloroflexota bacterium]